MLEMLLKEKYVNLYRCPLVKMCEGYIPAGSSHVVEKVSFISGVTDRDWGWLAVEDKINK